MSKRIISAVIMIMAIGAILFLVKEEGKITMNIVEVNIDTFQKLSQTMREITQILVAKRLEEIQEEINKMTVESNEEQVTQTEVIQEEAEVKSEEETIHLPEMDWALFLETEVPIGVAAGNFYWRYGIYSDFTSSQREGEEVYFFLNESILGKKLELASTLNRKEEENYENNHHHAWDKSREERIVGCSPDLEWIITWQMGERIERWYKNKEKVYEHDIEDTGYGRKGFIFQKEENGFSSLDNNLIIEAEKRLESLYQTRKFYSINYRTLYRFSSDSRVFAAANKSEWREPDKINIYSLKEEETALLFELTVPTDEMKWPIQIWQVKGDEHSGWVVFSYGYETFRITYPAGNIEKIGEYMFAASYSPDETYLAYCTGNEVMWYSWMNSMSVDVEEEMFLEQCYLIKKEMEKISQGWYVINLETGEKSYIPVPVWTYDADRPLYGGRCTWIEKDKLRELLEME